MIEPCVRHLVFHSETVRKACINSHVSVEPKHEAMSHSFVRVHIDFRFVCATIWFKRVKVLASSTAMEYTGRKEPQGGDCRASPDRLHFRCTGSLLFLLPGVSAMRLECCVTEQSPSLKGNVFRSVK